MDPLSVIASSIAIASLAWNSAATAYKLIEDITDAPNNIRNIKSRLHNVQCALDGLQALLKDNEATLLQNIFEKIPIDPALRTTRALCNKFAETLLKYTSHSGSGSFSKRDRLSVTFHKSRLELFESRLGDCQRTLTVMVSSVNLIISSRTSTTTNQLVDKFKQQEDSLAAINNQLKAAETSLRTLELKGPDDEDPGATAAEERALNMQILHDLQHLSEGALSTMRAERTTQSFGNMRTDRSSRAIQGIVGTANPGVQQSFGEMVTTSQSRGFQGQMDSDSFATFWQKS